jgi:hypothetical protein
MPGLDNAVPLPAGTESSALSRRSVLRGAAGAGAASIATAAFIGDALPAAAGTKPPAEASRGAGTERRGEYEPVVVHVRNATTGEIDVFRGTTETRLHDRDLAQRLLRAGRS